MKKQGKGKIKEKGTKEVSTNEQPKKEEAIEKMTEEIKNAARKLFVGEIRLPIPDGMDAETFKKNLDLEITLNLEFVAAGHGRIPRRTCAFSGALDSKFASCTPHSDGEYFLMNGWQVDFEHNECVLRPREECVSRFFAGYSPSDFDHLTLNYSGREIFQSKLGDFEKEFNRELFIQKVKEIEAEKAKENSAEKEPAEDRTKKTEDKVKEQDKNTDKKKVTRKVPTKKKPGRKRATGKVKDKLSQKVQNMVDETAETTITEGTNAALAKIKESEDKVRAKIEPDPKLRMQRRARSDVEQTEKENSTEKELAKNENKKRSNKMTKENKENNKQNKKPAEKFFVGTIRLPIPDSVDWETFKTQLRLSITAADHRYIKEFIYDAKCPGYIKEFIYDAKCPDGLTVRKIIYESGDIGVHTHSELSSRDGWKISPKGDECVLRLTEKDALHDSDELFLEYGGEDIFHSKLGDFEKSFNKEEFARAIVTISGIQSHFNKEDKMTEQNEKSKKEETSQVVIPVPQPTEPQKIETQSTVKSKKQKRSTNNREKKNKKEENKMTEQNKKGKKKETSQVVTPTPQPTEPKKVETQSTGGSQRNKSGRNNKVWAIVGWSIIGAMIVAALITGGCEIGKLSREKKALKEQLDTRESGPTTTVNVANSEIGGNLNINTGDGTLVNNHDQCGAMPCEKTAPDSSIVIQKETKIVYRVARDTVTVQEEVSDSEDEPQVERSVANNGPSGFAFWCVRRYTGNNCH